MASPQVIVDAPIKAVDNLDQVIPDEKGKKDISPTLTDEQVRGQAAAINANNAGTNDFVGEFQALSESEQTETGAKQAKDASDRVFDEKLLSFQRQMNDLLQEQAANPGPVVEHIEQRLLHQKQQAKLTQEREQRDSPERILTTQWANPLTITEDTRRAIQARAFMSKEAAQLMEGEGLLDLLGDLALDFIPFKFPLDALQAADNWNIFRVNEVLKEHMSNFHSLTTEEKKAGFPIIIEELEQTDIPKFRRAIIAAAYIDPAKMEDVDFEFGLLAPLDMFAWLTGIFRMGTRFRSSFNAIKMSKELDNPDIAGDISLLVAVDESTRAGTAVGIERLTAIDNALPFDVKLANQASTPDLAPKVQARIRTFKENLRKIVTGLEEGDSLLRPGLLLGGNIRAAAELRIDNIYWKYIGDLKKMDGVKNVTQISFKDLPNGRKWEYKITNSNGTVTKRSYIGTFIEDDVKHYENIVADKGIFRTLWDPIASPTARFTGTDVLADVRQAQRADFAEASIEKNFQQLMLAAGQPLREAIKPFTGRRKAYQQVEEILNFGDERGRVFTMSDLRQGINGIFLSEAQQSVYYRSRAIMDIFGEMRNGRNHSALVARNAKLIMKENQGVAFGTIVDNVADARTAIEGKNSVILWNDKGALDMTSAKALETIDQNYSAGWRLVKFDDPVLVDGKRFTQGIIRQEDILAPPHQVTRIHPGYVPRISKHGSHFVEAIVPGLIDGVKVEQAFTRVIRAFDNLPDAEEYIRRITVKSDPAVAAEVKAFPAGTKFRAIADGELEQFKLGITGNTSVARPFFSPRRSEAPPFGLPEQGLTNKRASAFEVTSLYLESTKNFMSRNEMRLGQQIRWEKTARKITGNTNLSFAEPGVALNNKTLKRWHDEVESWAGFLSKSETLWDDMVTALHRTSLKIPFARKLGVSNFIHARNHSSPAALIRSATFHTLLGAWNPVQLFIQASGATATLARGLMRPDRLGVHLYRQNAIMMTQNISPKNEAFNKIAKGFGWKPKDLEAHMTLWRKFGLYDSVSVNADYRMALQGSAITARGFRKALDSGLMFFREGELFNRRMAFIDTIEKLGGAKKVLKSITLQEEALSLTSDLVFNLGKSNRAFWQKGIWGIPTQFSQIITKSIETFTGLNGMALDAWGRIRLALTQSALFGAAGIPFGTAIFNMVQDAIGVDQEILNENPETVTMVTGGMLDWYLQTHLGAEVRFASRFSLLNGLDRSFLNLFTEESTWWEKATGPSSGPMKRVYDKFEGMSPFFFGTTVKDDFVPNEQDALDLTMDMIRDATQLAVSPTSTWGQLERYWWIREMDVSLSRNANVVTRGHYNTITEIMVAIGAKLDDQVVGREFAQRNKFAADYKASKVRVLMHAWDLYRGEINKYDNKGQPVPEEVKRKWRRKILLMKDMVDNEMVWRDIYKTFADKALGIVTGKSQLEIERLKWWENYRAPLVSEMDSYFNIPITTREPSEQRDEQ